LIDQDIAQVALNGDAMVLEDAIRNVSRELGAFSKAVHSMFGCEVAAEAVNHWLDVFESGEEGTGSISPTPYRGITIEAASRMARGMAKETSRSDLLLSHDEHRLPKFESY
jgi:hypothetical protein